MLEEKLVTVVNCVKRLQPPDHKQLDLYTKITSYCQIELVEGHKASASAAASEFGLRAILSSFS